MNTILFASAPPVEQEIRVTIDDWIPRDPGILILIGTLLLVTLGAFIWAAFFRKRPRRRHYEFHHHNPDRLANRIKDGWKAGRFLLRRHRHHRHREQRRNPTLAEAGGLPPVRTEEHPPHST
jgi:hypothetical protein